MGTRGPLHLVPLLCTRRRVLGLRPAACSEGWPAQSAVAELPAAGASGQAHCGAGALGLCSPQHRCLEWLLLYRPSARFLTPRELRASTQPMCPALALWYLGMEQVQATQASPCTHRAAQIASCQTRAGESHVVNYSGQSG